MAYIPNRIVDLEAHSWKVGLIVSGVWQIVHGLFMDDALAMLAVGCLCIVIGARMTTVKYLRGGCALCS